MSVDLQCSIFIDEYVNIDIYVNKCLDLKICFQIWLHSIRIRIVKQYVRYSMIRLSIAMSTDSLYLILADDHEDNFEKI